MKPGEGRPQLWAPFTIQIYVNGHDYVARQMVRLGLGFEQRDNAFVRLDDPRQAQKLADKFAKLKWPSILDAYANKVNPLRLGVVRADIGNIGIANLLVQRDRPSRIASELERLGEIYFQVA